MRARTDEQNPVRDDVVKETEWVEFRKSNIHGMGGYARRFIPKDTYIIEYVGERISKAESERRCHEENQYIFTYDEQFDLDGSVEWNPARWINHSCEANCETIDDEGHIWISAVRDIEPGEELTFNYCYDMENYKAHPCRCGSGRCVGYILAEEYHDRVRAEVNIERQAARCEEPNRGGDPERATVPFRASR